MNTCPVGGELLLTHGRTDIERQTDVMKLIVAFHNFSNAFKNGRCCTLNMYLYVFCRILIFVIVH